MLGSVVEKKPCISFGNLTLLDGSVPPGPFLNFFLGSGAEAPKRKFNVCPFRAVCGVLLENPQTVRKG